MGNHLKDKTNQSLGSSPQSPGSTSSDLEAGSAMSGQHHPLNDTDVSVDGKDRPNLTSNLSMASGLSLSSTAFSKRHLGGISENEEYSIQHETQNYSNESGTGNSSGNNNSDRSMETYADQGNLVNVDMENTCENCIIPEMNHERNRHQFQGHEQITSPTKTVTSASTDDTFSDSPILVSPYKSRIKSIRFAVTNEVREYTPNPDEFVDNPADVHRSMGCGKRTRLFFAASALPFMYGATSSLTTIFFFYELMVRYGSRAKIVGAYLVGAYLTRILFNSISRYAPKTFVFIGSLFALLGFAAIFVSQSPEFMDLNDSMEFEDDGLILFIVGSILANCNETIGGMQMFVRDQHKDDIKAMGSELKLHFLMAKMARIGSFIGASFLYQSYGVHGVAALGAGLVSLQILFLGAFLVLDLFRLNYDPSDKFEDEMIALKPKCRLNCSIRAARGRRRMFKSNMSAMNRTLAKYYPSHIPPSSVRYIVPICIFGRSISSIVIWSSVTIIMVDDFEATFITVGAVLACVATFDFLMSLLVLSWNKMATKESIYICMGGITLSSTAMAAPTLYAFIAGFMLYTLCNSILRILLIELQGSSNNANESFTMQLIRRSLTAGALYSLPLLYALHPRLPLILALWSAFFSSTILFMFLICCRKSRDIQKMDNDVEQNIARAEAANIRPSKRPERNLMYVEQVMLSRLIKGKDV